MEAVFNIRAEEFDELLFQKLKALLNAKSDLEITIAITETSSGGILRKENREEYFSRLNAAIENINKGKGISFTAEEFDDFSKHLLNEP